MLSSPVMQPFRKIQGILFVLLAAFAFASMNALSKLAQQYTNTPMVLFYRFWVAFVLLLPFVKMQGGLQSLKTQVPVKHLLRSIAGFSTLTLMILAVNYTSLTNAILLNITYPLFTPLIVFIWYKKPISLLQVIGLLIGFFGVTIVLQPDYQHFVNTGALLALLSGLAAAIAIQLTKALGATETNVTIGFYLFGFSTIITSLLVLFYWQAPSFNLCLILIGTGVTGFIYQQSLSRAINLTHPNFVNNLLFTSIFFGSVYNWLIWQQAPTLTTYLGLLLVLIGTTLAIIPSMKTKSFSYENE